MRLAKRKSDGAWYRTNKILRIKLPSANKDALLGALTTDAQVTALAQAYVNILDGFGVPSNTDAETLISDWLVHGIPREVWYGYARVDTYTKPAGKDYYVPTHAEVMRQGANSLRGIVSNHIRGWRMAEDITNINEDPSINPGGQADAEKE